MNREKIKSILRAEEGDKLRPYPDTKGHTSIGVGWNIDSNPLPPDIAARLRRDNCITEDDVNRLLDISIEAKIRDAQSVFPALYSWSETRQEAIVCLMFNMGLHDIVHKFPHFTKCVDAGDWEQAAMELKYGNGKGPPLSLWYQEVHEHRAEEILGMLRTS